MFMPRDTQSSSAEAKAKEEQRCAINQVERWATEAVPPKLRDDVQVSAQEVQCGDPNCAPIDTAIVIMFSSGGRGMVGIPAAAKEVTRKDLLQFFPTEDVLSKWHRGEEANWPPVPVDDEESRSALNRIERWATEAVPPSLRDGLRVSAQEVQCGDPNCSPVDTAIVVVFPSGGRGMIGVPAEAKDITREDLLVSFPPEDVLMKWQRGEEADWPPLPDFDDWSEEDESDHLVNENASPRAREDESVQIIHESALPRLRFDVGTRVECRVSDDGWAAGMIVGLWYREPNWPPQSVAPYRIRLDDGRQLFAPADVDQVIRREPSSWLQSWGLC